MQQWKNCVQYIRYLGYTQCKYFEQPNAVVTQYSNNNATSVANCNLKAAQLYMYTVFSRLNKVDELAHSCIHNLGVVIIVTLYFLLTLTQLQRSYKWDLICFHWVGMRYSALLENWQYSTNSYQVICVYWSKPHCSCMCKLHNPKQDVL